MSRNSPWFGYLEVGDKSSPVARDPKLNTGKPDTVYLFNLQRNAIIEYKREIVEPKLREFSEDEADLNKKVKKAFTKAAKDFTPRGKTLAIPDRPIPKPATAKKPKAEEEEFEGIDADNDDDVFDDED